MAAMTLRVGVANTAVGPLTTGSFTPAASDLLVGLTFSSGTVDAAPTFTNSLGIGFTLVTSAVISGSTAYLFVANTLAAASAQTCTLTLPNDNSTGNIIFVYSITGITRTGLSAVKQTAAQSTGTSGVAPAPVFSYAALTGNPCFGIVGNGTSPATLTPPSGWTETATIGDIGYSTPTTGAETAFINSGFTGTTVTWGGTSPSAFCAIACELDVTAAVLPDVTVARATV